MKRFNWKFWLSATLAVVVCKWIALSLSVALGVKSPPSYRPTAEAPNTTPRPVAPSAPVAPGLQFDPSTATLEPSPASPTQSPASQPAH